MRNSCLVVALLCLTVAGVACYQFERIAETARMSDAFVDAIGVHINTTIIRPDRARYAEKLHESGIRHVRIGFNEDNPFVKALYDDYGITTIFNHNAPQPMADLIDLDSEPYVDAVEGSNEPPKGLVYKGLADGPGWPFVLPASIVYQRNLYDAAKSDPRTRDKPVLSCSPNDVKNAHFFDPMKCDIQNMHNYPHAGRMPSYNLDQDILENERMSPPSENPKPIWCTEVGYGYAKYYVHPLDRERAITEKCGGKYMPRVLTEYFNCARIQRTYLHLFQDIGEDIDQDARPASNWYQTFGLVRADFSEKPAYRSIRNLISLLNDRGEPFTPSRLKYSLAGATPDVHHTLLQKRNGDFYLLVWQEIASCRTYADGKTPPEDMDNPAVAVTLHTPMRSASIYADLANPIYTTTDYDAGVSLSLQVSDEVIIVRITPVGGQE